MCRVSCQNKFVKLLHLVGFIRKKFITMHGHMNVKNPKIVKIFTVAYVLQELTTNSQHPATCQYPEPHESNPRLKVQKTFFLQVSKPKRYMHISFFARIPHAKPLASCSISPSLYLLCSTIHKDPHYITFSSLRLLPLRNAYISFSTFLSLCPSQKL